jgi:hypothetical protein
MFALIAYYRHFRKCGAPVGTALARAWHIQRHGF